MTFTPPARAPIFCEENRIFWQTVRRLLIAVLRMIDGAYGWRTELADKPQ